ncbi:Hypothetical protein D9617_4g001370 [Elsinoe fawcettii]|nr:Hypothetical protein D9617_4g001370 [Elsinoe fawcettii]
MSDSISSHSGEDSPISTPTTPPSSPPKPSPKSLPALGRELYFYPPEIAHDLDHVSLPSSIKAQTLACAWEYTRCVIPSHTNKRRYLAFMRSIIIGIIAEVRGDMIDVTAQPPSVLGYDLDGILEDLFAGTQGHADMAREYKSFLLITSHKVSSKRSGMLFTRYVNALAQSPRQWFRMRDADALARWSIAAALVCNDIEDVWFSEGQWEILAEIGDTMYDAIAFYKHRSEGETNSTFAYVPEDARIEGSRRARETLWALDVAWRDERWGEVVVNFLRFFGGPIHMMMRRYRFVEEGLTIGKPEDQDVVNQTRRNVKLWNRVDRDHEAFAEDDEQYHYLVQERADVMFAGLPQILQTSQGVSCGDCQYNTSYGATQIQRFGGVQLCHDCRKEWRAYVQSLPQRTERVFPEVRDVTGQ